MIPLALALAVLVQQQPDAQRPAPSPVAAANLETRRAIAEVAAAVGEMRSAHDALRRATFTQTDGMVTQWAQELQRDCRTVATVAQAAVPRVCRNCFPAATQRAMNGYRASLPSVAQAGTQCSTRLGQYLGGRSPAALVRRNIWSVSRLVVEGLYPYEARLREVRQALGASDPQLPLGARR